MTISTPIDLIECCGFFEKRAGQRQYEALRAYFLEGLASAEDARQFGYTPAADRMLCYDFRRWQLPHAAAATTRATQEEQGPRRGRGAQEAQLLHVRH